MSFPKFVKLVEVGPRDGLQNEQHILSTQDKINFIEQLSATGLSVIEAGSFVSAKRIPQLADSSAVFEKIQRNHTTHYLALVPNAQGFYAAEASGVTEIAVFTTASEEFSMKNTHCTVAESLSRIEEVMKLAYAKQIPVRAYLSCVLGCPYQGEIPFEKTAELAGRLFKMGSTEISLGDTIGIGTPFQVKKLLQAVSQFVPISQLAVHFHDTYGQALANIYAALAEGVAIVDSAVAGLGGCPYAKGATGNVATEEVLYMLNGMGIETGVDLQKLLQVGQFITQKLGRQINSKVGRAYLMG